VLVGPMRSLYIRPTADDTGGDHGEAFRVGHELAVVEAEHLFVRVPEQVDRFDAHLGLPQATLQQAPEVLASAGVDLPVHVALLVVRQAVDVTSAQPSVGHERVGADGRTFLDGSPTCP